MIELEIEDQTLGHVMILVDPTERGKGNGNKLVDVLQEKARELGIKEIHAYVESDAKSSLRCFQGANYEYQGEGKDGFGLYVLTICNN